MSKGGHSSAVVYCATSVVTEAFGLAPSVGETGVLGGTVTGVAAEGVLGVAVVGGTGCYY